MCLLKLPSISPIQTSTLLSRKTERIPHFCLSSTGRRGSQGRENGGWEGGHNHSPVEMSCSCDQCPSKVRLQRCIFSSDGSQDRQIMRSQPSQLQRIHSVWLGVFGQCLGPYESFSLLTAVLPNTAHFDSPLVTKNNTQSGKRNNAV